jgi:Fe-S cluster assembly protein SufD
LTMTATTAGHVMDEYLEQFSRLDNNAGSVFTIRKQAFDRFVELGFPTSRNEDWKYTNLSTVLRENYRLGGDLRPNSLSGSFTHLDIKANRLVFVDGVFAPEYSTILDKKEGLVIGSLADAFISGNKTAIDYYGQLTNPKDAFSNLNLAFAQDGAFVHVPKGHALQYPIALFFIYSPASDKILQSTRNLIVAEENSGVELLEFYQYEDTAAFTNVATTIAIKDNAAVKYNKVQENATAQVHIGTLNATLGRYSQFTANTFDFTGRIIRNNVTVNLDGEYAEVHLNGLYALDNSDHADNHIVVNHNVPNCQSNQLYKGLLDGKSDGAFNGRIYVKKDAQKTNAFQSNKNILLSTDANVNSKPQLEIFADDVKCSHGSTTGQIDKQALFYLRSRGLNKEQARAMLNIAFAGEIISKVTIEPLSNWLLSTLGKQLHTEEISTNE